MFSRIPLKAVIATIAVGLALAACVYFTRPVPVLPELNYVETIDGSHGKLVGDVKRPAVQARKVPVVIICHGLTGWRAENHNMAVGDSLLAHGYATVSFDFNGHGESEGKFSDMTIENELEDLHCIYDYVAGLPWVDKKRIAVAGHSQGGFVAGVFAGDMGRKKVKCAVLLAPAACIHVDAVNNIFFDAPASYEDLADSAFYWGRWFGKDYFRAAREIMVFERTGAYDGPVLIVQGDADMPNLLRDSRLYPNYIKNCKYVELPGLTHCFPENYALPASLSLEFIQQNL
ncbi:MAG: alpha/beta fold hydrolase [Bacteroidales bacterium]|nr:alpha/beta fold hydrolase [Bacteroidales bacterium]